MYTSSRTCWCLYEHSLWLNLPEDWGSKFIQNSAIWALLKAKFSYHKTLRLRLKVTECYYWDYLVWIYEKKFAKKIPSFSLKFPYPGVRQKKCLKRSSATMFKFHHKFECTPPVEHVDAYMNIPYTLTCLRTEVRNLFKIQRYGHF